MGNSKILDSLVGEKVIVACLDRTETSFVGELMEASDLGIVIKRQDHGREFIEFIPLSNLNTLSHKVLG